MLTRLGGQPMAVNPDLMEKAEATPDTVITLVDGHKFVVSESVTEVVDRVRAWRASVAAEAFSLSEQATPERHPSERHPSERHPSQRHPSQRHPSDDEWRPCDHAEDAADAADAVDAAAGSGPLARVFQMPFREE